MVVFGGLAVNKRRAEQNGEHEPGAPHFEIAAPVATAGQPVGQAAGVEADAVDGGHTYVQAVEIIGQALVRQRIAIEHERQNEHGKENNIRRHEDRHTEHALVAHAVRSPSRPRRVASPGYPDATNPTAAACRGWEEPARSYARRAVMWSPIPGSRRA